ncbi:MAG: EAL domain-containing protein [Hyphomicrobiales bacterium]
MSFSKFATAVILLAMLPIINFTVNFNELNQHDLVSKFSQIDLPVSDDLLIIEIDSESLKHFNSWPWKRSIYAELLLKLNSASPKSVAFDVDFSSKSSLKDDFAFAEAIKQVNYPVILPTVITSAQKTLDGKTVFSENVPIGILADNATLANANVVPDETGRVFNYSLFADNNRISIASKMWGKDDLSRPSFLIDYSIDLNQIAKYSVKDILQNNFNSAKIANKKILIGATAIDLGDIYSAPKYGRISGVYIHALAYETLAAGHVFTTIDNKLILLIAMMILVALVTLLQRSRFISCIFVNILAMVSIYIVSVILHHFFQIIMASSLLYVAVILSVMFQMFLAARSRTAKYFAERNANNFNKAIINHMISDNSTGIIICNSKGKMLVANQKAQQIFSIRKTAVHHRDSILKYITGIDELIANINSASQDSPRMGIVEQTITNKLGQKFTIEIMVKKSQFSQNFDKKSDQKIHKLYNFMISDITEKMNIMASKKQSELALIDLRLNDPLTKLPNRIQFINKLEESLMEMGGSSAMIALLRVDSIKEIAEIYGHKLADDALCQIAEKLRKNLGDRVTLARYADHTFGLIFNRINAGNRTQQDELLQQVYDIFKAPIDLKGQKIVASISMGVVLAPKDGDVADILLNNANQALEYAINSATLNWFFYEEDLANKVLEKRRLKGEIRRAIDNEEFVLYYQPQHDVLTRQLIGFEALIRWQDPHKGLRFPDEFIPVAEEYGLIIEIGEQVLKMGCVDAAKWPDHLTVAINVSPAQLRGSDMVALCKKYIELTGIKPHRLELEITESMMMHDVENVIKILTEIQKLDVKIAMDDFGTGYSSLEYLTQLPFDKIKIDRSFIMNIGKSAKADALLTSIVSLGHSLDKTVLAEGVETEDMLILLKAAGCQIGQGYLYGKPMPLSEVYKRIALENQPQKVG